MDLHVRRMCDAKFLPLGKNNYVHVSCTCTLYMYVYPCHTCTCIIVIHMCTIAGQFIRIWGRIPFTPGPQPPPLQQSEPYWQQMFDHQHQVHVIHTIPLMYVYMYMPIRNKNVCIISKLQHPCSCTRTVPHGYNLKYKRVFGSFECVTNAFAFYTCATCKQNKLV